MARLELDQGHTAADWRAAQDLSPAGAALYVAIARKQRSMREKGRTFTRRAARQWWSSRRAKRDIGEILLAAARRTAHGNFTPEQHLTEMGHWLRLELLRDLYPKKGRPRKRIGLIASARGQEPARRPGRRRLMDADEERDLVKYLCGLKVRILGERKNVDVTTTSGLMAILRYLHAWKSDIHQEVSDLEALGRSSLRGKLPPTSAPSAWLRRARTRSPFKVPLPDKQ